MRTSEQFMSEIEAILARYIAGGYEPDSLYRPHATAIGIVPLRPADACPGCREELGGKLICQCHPELNGEDE